MTDYDRIEKNLRCAADESGYWTACTEGADAIRELREYARQRPCPNCGSVISEAILSVRDG